MKDLKLTIAKNIAELRREHDLTQLQLAEKLNYSDKAISKWERGESIPDVAVLVEIAKIFSVSLDYLVTEDHAEDQLKTDEELRHKEATRKIIDKNHRAITGISIEAVWLVAVIFFVPIALFGPDNDAKWLCFVYAVPVASIVWLIFNTIWFNRRKNYIIISVLVWSLLASIHITALICGAQWHLVYLLGLPAELIIVLCSAITKKPEKQPQS